MSLFMASLPKAFGKELSMLTIIPTARRLGLLIPKSQLIDASPQYKHSRQIFTSFYGKNSSHQGSNIFQKYIIPGGIVAACVAAYTTYNLKLENKNASVTFDAYSADEYFLKESPPQITITRSIQSTEDKTDLKITLYQFQTCPFCCKVRAFLDFFGFSYDVVEVNSVTRKETKWSTYRKVPFVIIKQGDSAIFMQLKDSSMIISALQSFLVNKTKTIQEIVKFYPIEHYIDDLDKKEKSRIFNRYSIMYGQNPQGVSENEIISIKKWRKWIDDIYVHTLSPNIYRSYNESLQAFKYFSKVGNWEEHFNLAERLLAVYVGSVAMYFIGKRLKKRYGLKDDVRESLYEETNKWTKELKMKGGKFMGGEEPNLSDLELYGVLSAIEGCDAFNDVIVKTKIQPWYLNMKNVVNSHAGAKYIERRGNSMGVTHN